MLPSHLFRILNAVAVFVSGFALAAYGQMPDEVVKAMVDHRFILLRLGDHQSAKVKRDALLAIKGNCDVAVRVKEARWDRSTAHFVLTPIGHPAIPGKNNGRCTTTGYPIRLKVSGFSADERPDSISSALQQVLMTPEQYLAFYGVPYDSQPAPAGEPAVRPGQGTKGPRPLLTLDPEFSEEARQQKYQGTLAAEVVIGADGRVRKTSIVRRLGKGLDEAALEVLPMWRFQPCLRDQKPVACIVTIEVSYNLY